MGTHALIRFRTLKHIYTVIYHHWDGGDVGSEFNKFYNSGKIVNGYSSSHNGEYLEFNGFDDLIIQYIVYVKSRCVQGGVYMMPSDTELNEEFNYDVVYDEDNKTLKVNKQ